ncbi:hypothetical protein TNCT_331251 [Trichonephila clavata]|uniref:Uncharacterized protein n=1 Tax=Trichonephila clavata TaxID=2740835 RepID=A0A8X6I7D8_TRICU|nr:hypothetical protein TNCT_331251 [Trichonephila clavata]
MKRSFHKQNTHLWKAFLFLSRESHFPFKQSLTLPNHDGRINGRLWPTEMHVEKSPVGSWCLILEPVLSPPSKKRIISDASCVLE